MAREKKPWFPFDATAFMADLAQAAMTLEEVGAYIRLLAWSWREGPLPADHATLARVLKVSTCKMAALWPALAPCWTLHDDGTITNPRLEAERDHANVLTETRRGAGAKGAKGRWQKPSQEPSSEMANAIDAEQQLPVHARVVCVPVPVSSVDPEPGEEPEKGADRFEPDELWDHWRHVADQAGAPQPSIAGPGVFAHLRELARDYTAEQLRSALEAWWASPHTGGRNLGLFRSQAGEVLEWLQRSPGVPFRAPRPERRAVVTDFVQRDDWQCHHDPHCGSRWRCEQRTALDEQRAQATRAEVHA